MVGSVLRALVFKLAPGAPLVPVMIAIWALSVAVPLAMEQVAARLGLGALAGFARSCARGSVLSSREELRAQQGEDLDVDSHALGAAIGDIGGIASRGRGGR
jgi:hypothetical protein